MRLVISGLNNFKDSKLEYVKKGIELIEKLKVNFKYKKKKFFLFKRKFI